MWTPEHQCVIVEHLIPNSMFSGNAFNKILEAGCTDAVTLRYRSVGLARKPNMDKKKCFNFFFFFFFSEDLDFAWGHGHVETCWAPDWEILLFQQQDIRRRTGQ